MKIVFKGSTPDEENPPLRDYELEGLAELRRLLPHDYQMVKDRDLLSAWEDFSEDLYCAGFMGVSEDTVKEFVDRTKVVED